MSRSIGWMLSTSHPTSESDTEHITLSSEWDRLKWTSDPLMTGLPLTTVSMHERSASSPMSSRALRSSSSTPKDSLLSLSKM